MTIGAPDQLCCCSVHCSPGKERRLAVAEMKVRAALYASGLTDGDEIHGDPGGTDADYIAPFAAYLPEALVTAGFRITVRLGDAGRLVTVVHKQKEGAI